MKVKEIGHLAFTCADLDKSLHFYKDVLGFEEVFQLTYSDRGQQRDGDNRWIVYVKVSDRQFIELFNGRDASEYAVPSNKDYNYSHLALIVEDIEEVKKTLLANGAPVDRDINMGPDCSIQMWTHDPDGNKIEFMQYTDKSYQFAGRPD